MKRSFLLLLFIMSGLSVFSQTSLTNGLYICYPLDGNASDYSGNSHNGSVFGATSTTDRFGSPGMAMSFNGANNYITVNNIMPDMAHFSISVWVYHTKVGHPSGIFSDSDPAGYNDLFFNVANTGVGIDANKPGGTLNKLDLDPLGNYGQAVTGMSLNNAWHHIVWVCDSGTQQIYVDTVLKYSSSISGTNKGYHNTNASIGRLGDGVSNGGYFQYFQGSMDEFKVYSRAINFSEVKALFFPNSCTGTFCIPPTVNISGASGLCSGNSTVLTASGSATSYTWSSNAGSANTNTVSVSPSSSTTYTVFASDTSSCPAMSTITISVTATPTLSISGSTSICSGNGTTLTGFGATSYTWNTGSISVTSPSINANPGSTMTFTLTGANGNCFSSQPVTITVNPTPTVTMSGLNAICSGSSTVLSAGGATTYTWSANAGSANTSTVSVSPTSTTAYTVVGSNGNCLAQSSITVTVASLPNINILADPSTICSGASVAMTGSGANTYTWSANAGGVNTNTASVTPPVTTTYTLSGSNSFCTNSNTITITVLASPTLIVNSPTICIGGTGTLTVNGAVSYTWTPSPQFSNSNSSIVLDSPNQTTTYTVIGTALNGCKTSDTTTIVVDPCSTGISNFENDKTIWLYPNPTQGKLTIQMAGVWAPTEFKIFNYLGSEVKRGILYTSGEQVDLDGLPNGIYTFAVLFKNKTNISKIVLQK